MGKTILELDTSEASITDDSVYYIATQKSSDTKAKKTVLTKIVTYLKGVFHNANIQLFSYIRKYSLILSNNLKALRVAYLPPSKERWVSRSIL